MNRIPLLRVAGAVREVPWDVAQGRSFRVDGAAREARQNAETPLVAPERRTLPRRPRFTVDGGEAGKAEIEDENLVETIALLFGEGTDIHDRRQPGFVRGLRAGAFVTIEDES